jgi:hypothetical protein
MKLRNTATRAYMHGSTIFKAGEVREFAKDMAEAFKKCAGVIEEIAPEEIAKLKEELAELKAKEVIPKEVPDLTRKEMLKIAEEKGLEVAKNISNAKLAELIK